jgi:DNA polymerase-3 subunit alpha
MLYNIEGVLSAVENERRFSGQGQLDLFDEMGSPNTFVPQHVPEMSQEMRLSLEKEATGLYLSGHPLDKYEAFLKGAKFDSLTSVIEGKYSDGQKITVVGIVSGLKVRQLKNNNLLATAQIEGIDASVNITVFDKAYMIYKPYLTDSKPIILTGRISEREDRETEIICEKIEAIPENLSGGEKKPNQDKNKVLWLRIESLESPDFEKVKEILSQNKGEISVNIFCTKTNKKLSAPKSLYVTLNESLTTQLKTILGEENVKITN